MHGPEGRQDRSGQRRRLSSPAARAARRRAIAIDGVIHAWSLDSGAWDGMSGADLTEAETRSAISPLLLAQALVAEPRPPRLWIVTRGGQQTDGSERSVSPVQAAAWGLGRSIALEHPELNCTCVDLDPGPHPGEVDALLVELETSRGSESQVALRAAGRRVARLVRDAARRSSRRHRLPRRRGGWRPRSRNVRALPPSAAGSSSARVRRSRNRRAGDRRSTSRTSSRCWGWDRETTSRLAENAPAGSSASGPA